MTCGREGAAFPTLDLCFEYARLLKRVCWRWDVLPRKSEPGFESSPLCSLANKSIASFRYAGWAREESVMRLVLYVGPNRT